MAGCPSARSGRWPRGSTTSVVPGRQCGIRLPRRSRGWHPADLDAAVPRVLEFLDPALAGDKPLVDKVIELSRELGS